MNDTNRSGENDDQIVERLSRALVPGPGREVVRVRALLEDHDPVVVAIPAGLESHEAMGAVILAVAAEGLDFDVVEFERLDQ